MATKQKAPLIKAKLGSTLGFRTSDHFRARGFGKGAAPKFDPGRFKTQHKG